MKIDEISGLLHGGDYNPDQWLDYPEILEDDIELMKEAGVNVVTLGVFSWSSLEPEEGVFTFEWLDNIMDRLYENGIYVILSTPSAARPPWLAKKYPEMPVPEKLPMPRPVDRWFKDWQGPVRSEFRDDIDIKELNGNSRWQLYCLERFLDMLDRGEI